MKARFVFVLLALSACFAGRAQSDSPEIVKAGDNMPAFTIVSDNGVEISSSAFRGKVILINFFATWCPPCQKELADVEQKLWAKYKDNKNFALLVIGREHTDDELAKYNEKKGFTFPLYPDKGRKIFDTFAKSQIPRSYLIGKNGKVIHVSVGYTEEEFNETMARIDRALK